MRTENLYLTPHPVCMPPWLGLGIHEERKLPLEPGDYKVTPGERWTVTLLKTGETIYSGLGPVEVMRSPAPFWIARGKNRRPLEPLEERDIEAPNAWAAQQQG